MEDPLKDDVGNAKANAVGHVHHADAARGPSEREVSHDEHCVEAVHDVPLWRQEELDVAPLVRPVHEKRSGHEHRVGHGRDKQRHGHRDLKCHLANTPNHRRRPEGQR
eukprot:CAMPEP_0175455974 /NCGR_PEP_ID=MMETSP0095-20121207/65302_1 /TAXON_ID=311494 /ORGANISM="Alexandrium monilatum, Strain CCMP3105" /LENGTH=107 /DNA_ID=CAMNT_0016756775 /DNA_START=89 /DNA_END=412 /DNA_ORIENTATION=+